MDGFVAANGGGGSTAGARFSATVATSACRRALGAGVVILGLAPLYRILPHRPTGLAGRATAEIVDVQWDLLWAGFFTALVPAVAVSVFLRPGTLDRSLSRVGKALARPPLLLYAGAAALISGVVTTAFSLLVLDGKPNLIDALSQLLHARYVAAGRLAGPVEDAAFWIPQNSVVTNHGWVSQYPPGFVVLLALGFRLGGVWLVGPVLMAWTAFVMTLLADRIVPGERSVPRLAALLVAVSPFLIAHAGAYMNHAAAAAFGCTAIYCALRSREGRPAWALGAGAAMGWLFAIRPLSAMVVACVVVIAAWPGRAVRARPWWRSAAMACIGGLPFIAALAAYNAHFFGSPFRLGYVAALGPATGLGFGIDPWGNTYGPVEAVAYTSADLIALNINLLEVPIPAVVISGMALIAGPRLTRGECIVAAWAFLAVLANAFYWHHGQFMGPRMLNESAPAWILLTTMAAVRLVQLAPDRIPALPQRYSPRTAMKAVLVCAIVIGATITMPRRLLSYGGEWMRSSRIEVPRPTEPSVVFVHGGWITRVGATLAAEGMRLDTLETALRQNSTCRVQMLADSIVAGRVSLHAGPPDLDLSPRSSGFPMLVEISPKNAIRLTEGELLPERCLREIRADRRGVIDVTPLVWRGDLPWQPGKGAIYVRDLGPERNERLIRSLPDRTPMVLYKSSPDAPPRLLPYEDGMAAIWGATTNEAEESARE